MVETVNFNLNPRPFGEEPLRSTLETPEGDVSLIQAGVIQPLPTYTEHDESVSEPLLSSVDPNDRRHVPPAYAEEITPVVDENSSLLQESKNVKTDIYNGNATSDQLESIARFLPVDPDALQGADLGLGVEEEEVDAAYTRVLEEQEAARKKANVVRGFFNGIKFENSEAIDLFISRGLVTANTIDEDGRTPLLAAVATKNVKIVQQLLDAGAEPDAFGVTVSRGAFSYTR